jgi:hypothetical protein
MPGHGRVEEDQDDANRHEQMILLIGRLQMRIARAVSPAVLARLEMSRHLLRNIWWYLPEEVEV